MKRSLALSLLVLACSQPETTALPEISSLAEPSQTFTINNATDTTIVTKSGMKVIIPANSLVNVDSTEAAGPITITISEMVTKSEMVINNISSVADRKLIESFGIFFITATSEGKELISTTVFHAQIPNRTAEPAWNLSYGQKIDSVLEWMTAPEIVEEHLITVGRVYGEPDTVLYERKVLDPVQAQIPTGINLGFTSVFFSNLGWINYNRFVDSSVGEPITIHTSGTHHATCYIVFQEINSVLAQYVGNKVTTTITSIPPGYKASAMIIDFTDNQYYFASQQFETGALNSITFDLKPISWEGLSKNILKLDSFPK